MPFMIVGVKHGKTALGMAEKLTGIRETVIITRTEDISLSEYIDLLRVAIKEHPESIIIADDVTEEFIPRERIPFTSPMEELAELESCFVENIHIPDKISKYESLFIEDQKPYSKYQKGRDKKNK